MNEPDLLAFLDQRDALVALRAQGATAAVETSHRSLVAIDGREAEVSIVGPMLRDRDELADYFGIAYTPMRETAAAIRALGADPNIETITLRIDSPGGEVNGTDELAEAIAESPKTTVALVDGMAASAAYWVASAAQTIKASATSLVGSIGVYTYLTDSSAAFASAGVKRILITSGPVKGQGVPGVPVNQAAIDDTQATVDALAAMFRRAVSEYRGLDLAAVEQLATGATWVAEQAVAKGLIDAVGLDAATPIVAPITTSNKANHMDPQIVDLIVANPQHAAVIRDLAADGADLAAAQVCLDELNKAEALKVLKVERDQALADRDSVRAEIEKVKAERDDLQTQFDAMAALSTPHGDPGPSAEADQATITRAKFDAMNGKDRARFTNAGGKIAG